MHLGAQGALGPGPQGPYTGPTGQWALGPEGPYITASRIITGSYNNMSRIITASNIIFTSNNISTSNILITSDDNITASNIVKISRPSNYNTSSIINASCNNNN